MLLPTSYVLINSDLGKDVEIIAKIKELIAGQNDVKLEIQGVYGVYDIILKLSADDSTKLRSIVTNDIRKIENVQSTLTMMVMNNKKMDKNHTRFENFELLQNNLIPSSSNLLFYEDAFSKIKLIKQISTVQPLPILYFDLDFLFSGFTHSKLLALPNLSLFNTLESHVNEILPKILAIISTEPHLVILDSINGLYNTLSNDEDSGRIVNSILMLVAQNVKFSKSILIISALAKKKEGKWLLPNGRQILENENMKKFFISDRSKINIEK